MKPGRVQFKQRQIARLTRLNAEKRCRDAIQRVLNALGLPADLFRNLPENERRSLIEFRFRSVRIEPSEGVRVPRRVLNIMRLQLSVLLKQFMVPVMPGYKQVSLEDFFTAGLTLAAFAGIKMDPCPEAVLFAQKQLQPFVETAGAANIQPKLKLLTAACMACLAVNRINQTMYFLKLCPRSEGFGISFKLHEVKPESRYVIIDNKSRPVWRIGIAMPGGMKWSSVTAGELGITSAFADLPMQVYIQSHALVRLRERADSLGPVLLHSELYHSFDNKEIVPLGHNRALVGFGLPSAKIGYLLVEIIEGVAVVKTFLFITNSGTPEGAALDRELHVGKMEKEFLQIDKLSVFVKTDFTLDQRVRDVFERAGLGHLCRLDPEMFGKKAPDATGYAEDFVKYLGLE